jgi:hypothetical protein
VEKGVGMLYLKAADIGKTQAILGNEGNYVEKGVDMLYLKATDNGKTQASSLF